MFRFISSATLLIAFTQPALADPFQPAAAIDRQVAAFTGAQIGQPGGANMPVDEKLRLRACSVPLDLAWHGSARQAVVVSCGDAGGWRIFVPTSTLAAAPERVLVQRRDQVRLEASGGGFSIARQGQALEAGSAGDWIRVQLDDPSARSRSAGKVITGQVQADGRVRVAIR